MNTHRTSDALITEFRTLVDNDEIDNFLSGLTDEETDALAYKIGEERMKQ